MNLPNSYISKMPLDTRRDIAKAAAVIGDSWIPDMKPIRIQRSRKKGSKMVSPNGLPIVCVTRPGPWGNPITIGGHFKVFPASTDGIHWTYLQRIRPDPEFETVTTAKRAVELFRELLTNHPWKEQKLAQLRGKNLACWCSTEPGTFCHADVLLEIANK